MDSYTKKAILNKVEKIILRLKDEIGHTNGMYVSNEILKQIKKL